MLDDRSIRSLVAVTLLAAGGFAGTARADAICDAGALAAALAAASPGDVVEVGTCTVTGSFTVPAGVTLRGSGALNTTIDTPSSGDGVVLATGGGTTALERVRVRSAGGIAIRVTGSGAAAVRDGAVVVTRGVGLVAVGTGSIAIEHVGFGGSVVEALAHTVPPLADSSSYSTHGIVLSGVGSAALLDVSLGGFARAGALVHNTDSTWVDARAIGNVALGIAIAGGRADMVDVRVQSTWQGMLPPDEPPAGVAIVGRASVRTTDLSANDNDGFGVFHDESAVVNHDDLAANGNGHAGVWARDGGYLEITDARISGNSVGGVVAIDTGLVSIEDARIERTAGDGVMLVRSPGDFTGLTLRRNDRIGLLAELAGSATVSDYVFRDVMVDASGASLGVILQQGGAPLPLITTGITRRGATLVNDTAFVAQGVGLGIVSDHQPQWLSGLLIGQGGLNATDG